MPNQILNLKNFDYVIGIDQTGATLNGVPKTLPCTFIDLNRDEIHLGLNLPSFNISSFNKIIPHFSKSKTLIVVDAVLGFPQNLSIDFFKVITLLKKSNGYGLKVAEDFYNNLKKEYGIDGNPLREVEQILNANSVFTPYPFQRNIQTGTYRILKDLSYDHKWFNILPYENNINYDHYILEGYPSKAFKELIDSNRSRELFNYFLDSLIIDKIEHKGLSLDHIDSAMLALQAWSKEKLIFNIDLKSEGWIL